MSRPEFLGITEFHRGCHRVT